MTASFARYGYRYLFMLIMVALCAPAVAGASELQGNKPFLASSINNNHPFVCQEILLTYRLYFRDIAPKISNEMTPSLQGLWARETGAERFIKSIPATVKGKEFRSAVVKQFKLVPIQSGKITVSGYSMLCTLPQEHSAADKTEPIENSLRITAPPITISARALPEPVPEKLSGAVGIFSLNLVADKEKLKIGEPLSLKLILTGTGSLLTLELPGMQLPESFRHNPPEKTTNLIKESETTSGSTTSTTLAWPQSEGDFQIPAVTLVVFNPDTQQFSILHSKPLAIRVDAAGLKAAGERDKPLNGFSENKSKATTLFSTVTIAFLLLISCTIFVLIRKKRLTGTKKKGAGEVTEQSPEIGKSARTMKQQLLALLSETGVKSPGSMTRMELQDALQEMNIPDETRSELPSVLDSLDKILYSPAREKESRIPDWITTKVNALLHDLKKACSSR